MEKLKVVLDWFPNTNHIGFLIAQKRGWFAEAGLDVEIFGDVHGEMELHGADFVCGPEIAMLDCMERGIGLTAVAVMTQKCDSGIVSLKEAGITRPRELEGKRLTHWSPEWFHKAISRVMAKDGGDYGKVKLVNLDVGDIVATLGDVADATWVYENWENQVLLEEYIRFRGALIELGKVGNAFTAELSNEQLAFKENGQTIAYISNQSLVITNAEIRNKLSLGNEDRGWFDFIPRTSGNLSIVWRAPAS